MASFLEELWNSVFTAGPNPTLLVATNATFGALQCVLLILLLATHSVHFIVLSFLSAGLWYSINWFAREMQAEQARSQREQDVRKKEKSAEPGSDTETEAAPIPRKILPSQAKVDGRDSSALLHPRPPEVEELRRRRSVGEAEGYVSTDSEWEKVSEGEKES